MVGLVDYGQEASVPTETATPVRVQLSRAKGWKMPANTVKVDRTTRFGNPWTEGDPGKVRIVKGCEISLPMAVTRAGVIDRFRRWMAGEFDQTHGHQIYEAVIPPQTPKPDIASLRGKNLACWCKPGEPCHADVLLELANAPSVSPAGYGAKRNEPKAIRLATPAGDESAEQEGGA